MQEGVDRTGHARKLRAHPGNPALPIEADSSLASALPPATQACGYLAPGRGVGRCSSSSTPLSLPAPS